MIPSGGFSGSSAASATGGATGDFNVQFGPKTNWPLLAGIIAAAVCGVAVIFIFRNRKGK